jgi:hypothetical protein
MSKSTLEKWEHEFRKAAEADELALFREHLRNLALPDEPEKLLEGSILAVRASCAYASIDGQSYTRFLAMQKYRPPDTTEAEYIFTFDLCGKAFARVLVPADIRAIDLADLYGHPWWEYEVVGYRCFWVSRTDGKPLSSEDSEYIEKAVTEDLRFDYSEDELGFWFDNSIVKGVLYVYLYEVDTSFEDEEDGDSGL